MSRSQRRSRSAREERRNEDTKRVAAWRELSPAEQLRSLDGRLGKGIGAKRQRAKLGQKMFTPVTAPPEPVVLPSATTKPEKKSKKRKAA